MDNAMTPLDIETAMQNHWGSVHGMRVGMGILKSNEEDEEDEVVLFAGICYNYGEHEHNAQDCQKKQANKFKGKFSGKCKHC